MTCTVVNIRVEPFDVYIGRPSQFGNPYALSVVKDRARCIELYRDFFQRQILNDRHFRRAVLKLAGKRLGCYCKPAACHGDVIAAWVNEHAEQAP